MEAADTVPAAGIGEQLRRAREQRGLTVEECAERLYLPGSVLVALEGEEYAALGAGVYARGHLRRYAGLLELDAAALEQGMLQRLVAAPDLAAIVTRRVGNTNPGRRLGLLPVAIVAVVLALAVLVWWSSRHTPELEPAPGPVAVPVTPGASSTPAAPPDSAPVTEPAPAPPRAALDPADDHAGGNGPAAAPRPADAPLVVATANPRPAPPPSAAPAPANAQVAAPASVNRTAPAPRAAASPAATPPAAAKGSSAPVAPRRGDEPQPAEPSPRETRSDYMNFDF